MKKSFIKIAISSFSVLLIVIIATAFSKQALAGITELGSGWAWGGGVTPNPTGYDGIGWISFNSADCDFDNNGTNDNPSCGVIGGAISNYGVNIPLANGNLSGYAWSEWYGWISFNGSDLAGCAPALAQASRSGNTIIGGARIIAIKTALAAGNAGGYDGCISLSGGSYGVTIAGTNLSGYGWSSDLGWIDFTGVTITSPSAVLNAYGCTIPTGASTCNGTFDWKFIKGTAPFDVRNVTNGIVYGSSAFSIGTTGLLNYGSNTIEATDGAGNADTALAIANCDTSIDFWHATNSKCTTQPPKPVVTVSADPSLIRSGETAPILININSAEPSTCTVYNALSSPQIFHHTGTPVSKTYNYTTRSLTAAQVVTVTCSVDIYPPVTGEGKARVSVVGILQET